jgi:hypothetical protein
VCDSNFYWNYLVNGTSGFCLSCPGNTVSKIGRQSSCDVCPSGKFSDVGQCTDCPDGTWNNNANSSTCAQCPKSPFLTCPSGSKVPFVTSGGVFRSLTDPSEILPCVPEQACASTGFNDTVCEAGYTDYQCSQCTSEYFRNAGRCVKCLPKGVRWFIVLSTIVLFIIIISRLSEKQSSIPPSFRLILFWMQFLSLLPALSDAWPPALLSFLSLTSVFNLDIGYLGVGCDVKSSYITILVLKILMPVIFLIFLVLENIILKLLKIIRQLSWFKIASNFTFIANFFAIQLLSSLLQIFSCVDAGGGVFVVKQDPTTRCFEGNWYRFVSFVIVLLLLYFIAYPVFLIWRFRKAKRLGETDVLKELFAPLFQNYRQGYEWFELVRVGFRIGFVMVRDVFVLSSSAKVVFLGLLLMILLYIESENHPYVDRHFQSLSILYGSSISLSSWVSDLFLGGQLFV